MNFVEEDAPDQPPGTVLRTDPRRGHADPEELPLRHGSSSPRRRRSRSPTWRPSTRWRRRPRSARPGSGSRPRTEIGGERLDPGGPGSSAPIPGAGTLLPRDTEVTLLISSGPALVDVPERASGRRAPRRRARSPAPGSACGSASGASRRRRVGLVVEQSPADGERRAAVVRHHHGGHLTLDAWYRAHGRHDLAWRATRDRWAVLVSETMLHQTQVSRVAAVYDEFLARFPTPAAMAEAGPGAVITAWGRLGYPRRARRLWEASVVIAADGWPDDLTALPGVGPLHRRCDRRAGRRRGRARARRERAPRGRAGARRPAHHDGRRTGDAARSGDRCADATGCSRSWTSARCCAARATRVAPSARSVAGARRAARSPTSAVRTRRPFAGSFRQRRGHVMAKLREGSVPAGDARRRRARVPRRRRPRGRGRRNRPPALTRACVASQTRVRLKKFAEKVVAVPR